MCRCVGGVGVCVLCGCVRVLLGMSLLGMDLCKRGTSRPMMVRCGCVGVGVGRGGVSWGWGGEGVALYTI